MTSLQAVERTMSELNLLGPDGWPAWTQVLQKAHKTNYGRSDDPIYLHLASKTRLGAVTLLAVQFQDFLLEDGRYLLLQLSMTDQNLLSTIQSNQVGQLAWQMPKSREYFHLTGKFYICSAPRQVTRYSPPVLPYVINQNNAEDLAAQRQVSNQFWESKRLEQWRKLPAKARASYTWPQAGSTPKGPPSSFQCLAMEDMTATTTVSNAGNRDSVMSQDSNPMSSPSSPSSVSSFRSRWNLTGSNINNTGGDISTPTSPVSSTNGNSNKIRNDNPAKILHDIAFDNFCLLVFKPLDIVHFESSPLPPKRTIYTTDAAGQWAVSEANP
ncbi:hypothetical protein BGZ95_008471 [Linnemannia exigua]|uniref:Uncharacterized protein n=1 Tax=Linnemannia exigua TaxID=604196 RepID=A0AAD4DFT0_9FUNG|nr:hypothetical protein BGZ95_008471 [Linnemannia exigua]